MGSVEKRKDMVPLAKRVSERRKIDEITIVNIFQRASTFSRVRVEKWKKSSVWPWHDIFHVAALSWHLAPRERNKGTDEGEESAREVERSERRGRRREEERTSEYLATTLHAASQLHPRCTCLPSFCSVPLAERLSKKPNHSRTVFHQLFLLAHSCILSSPLRAAVRLLYRTHRHPLFICHHTLSHASFSTLSCFLSLSFSSNANAVPIRRDHAQRRAKQNRLPRTSRAHRLRPARVFA